MNKWLLAIAFSVLLLVPLGVQNAFAGAIAAPTDLKVTKTASVTQVIFGDIYEYVITVENLGPNDVTLGDIEDFLPFEVDFISVVSGETCLYDAGDHAVFCDLNNLVVGAETTVTITVQVAETTTIPRKLFNEAASFPDDGDPDDSNNFPFVEVTWNPAGTISGVVWNDLDRDGIREMGEPLVEGIVVDLADLVAFAIIATTKTDMNGAYSFTNLVPGTYGVGFSLSCPTGPCTPFDDFTLEDVGPNDDIDSDVDPSIFAARPIVLAAGETISNIDAGMFLNAGIGDFVWHDLDGDGIQDGGEPGIADVTVNLRNGIDTIQLDSTTTDATGFYQFGLPPGAFIVEFVLKAGFDGFSPQDAGLDDAIDSDADVNTGKTGIITVTSGQTKNTIDAGMIQIDGEPSPQPVGGALIPIDTTSLLLAYGELNSWWMAPIVIGIGVGVYLVKRRF